jgi:hypothetical protein
MRGETVTQVNEVLEIVHRLPVEHQARFSRLVDLLLMAPQSASDRAQRLIWSAVGVSRISSSDCLFQLDCAIEYLSRQCATHHPSPVAGLVQH